MQIAPACAPTARARARARAREAPATDIDVCHSIAIIEAGGRPPQGIGIQSAVMGSGAMPSYPAATHNTGPVVHALQTFGLQLVSGGGAGAISKTAVAPIERIKVVLQVERGSGSGAVSVATTIMRTQGVRAFWRVRMRACEDASSLFGVPAHERVPAALRRATG